MAKYTFETKHLSETWVRSSQEHDKEDWAIEAALAWAKTCLENGTAVAIKVVPIK